MQFYNTNITKINTKTLTRTTRVWSIVFTKRDLKFGTGPEAVRYAIQSTKRYFYHYEFDDYSDFSDGTYYRW